MSLISIAYSRKINGVKHSKVTKNKANQNKYHVIRHFSKHFQPQRTNNPTLKTNKNVFFTIHC